MEKASLFGNTYKLNALSLYVQHLDLYIYGTVTVI